MSSYHVIKIQEPQTQTQNSRERVPTLGREAITFSYLDTLVLFTLRTQNNRYFWIYQIIMYYSYIIWRIKEPCK